MMIRRRSARGIFATANNATAATARFYYQLRQKVFSRMKAGNLAKQL